MRRSRGGPTSSEGSSKFYDSTDEKQNSVGIPQRKFISNRNAQSDGDTSLGSSSDSANKTFDTSSNLDGTLIDGDQTIIENGLRAQSKVTDICSPASQYVTVSPTVSPSKLMKPPPLPPKPKSLLTNAVKAGLVISAKSYPTTMQTTPSPPTESRESTNIF